MDKDFCSRLIRNQTLLKTEESQDIVVRIVKRNAKLKGWSTSKSKTLDQATIMLDLVGDD
jgi:hypothetical protein